MALAIFHRLLGLFFAGALSGALAAPAGVYLVAPRDVLEGRKFTANGKSIKPEGDPERIHAAEIEVLG